MEKRLITAVLLSLFILYIWAGLTQKSGPAYSDKSTQDIDIKGVTSDSLDSESLTLTDTEVAKEENFDKTDSDEQLTTLENDKLMITFTNIGGMIKETYIKTYDEELPITRIAGITGYENVLFTLDKKIGNRIDYKLETDKVTITNSFKISDDGYSIDNTITLVNKDLMSKDIDLSINSITVDADRMDISNKNRDKSLNEYALSAYDGVHRKGGAFKFNAKENKSGNSHVVWSAFRNRYFCAIFKPDFESNGYKIHSMSKTSIDLQILVSRQLKGGEAAEFSSLIFIGPERHDILTSYNLGLEKVKKFYRFGLFDIIAMAIYRLMNIIFKVIPNWGICICIISVILYFSMYPLTLRGMSSMKRMQALQPEVAKIKEKYSSNPQKMNQEMMLIYKEHKINPIGGCLPFLLQMPIFIGLYQVLWRSVSFKGASFLWIEDLSQPDRFYILPFKVPFMGNEINLLPILMMIIMFFQQKISAKNMTTTDPMQRQQQKMMGTIMPVFLGVIFYKFASGLTLYFTLFYIFSTFTQFHMYKKKSA